MANPREYWMKAQTATVPVTTLEEIALLSDEERSGLVASLEEAQEQISNGNTVEYDQKLFVERLLRVYRGDLPEET